MTLPYSTTAGDLFGDHFDVPLEGDDDVLQAGWSHDIDPPDVTDDGADGLDDCEYELWSRD
jgi:hypothetical protein